MKPTPNMTTIPTESRTDGQQTSKRKLILKSAPVVVQSDAAEPGQPAANPQPEKAIEEAAPAAAQPPAEAQPQPPAEASKPATASAPAVVPDSTAVSAVAAEAAASAPTNATRKKSKFSLGSTAGTKEDLEKGVKETREEKLKETGIDPEALKKAAERTSEEAKAREEEQKRLEEEEKKKKLQLEDQAREAAKTQEEIEAEQKAKDEAEKKRQERLQKLGFGFQDTKTKCIATNMLIAQISKLKPKSNIKDEHGEFKDLVKIVKDCINNLDTILSGQKDRLETSQDPTIFMLRHYAGLSVTDDFQYQSAKAGDRPEIKELEMRGDISQFDRLIDQEINTVLNKYSTDILADKLVELLTSKKSVEDKNLIIMFRTLFVNVYEKACIEVKFVHIYAEALIRLFDLVNTREEFRKLCIRYITAFVASLDDKNEETEQFKSFLKLVNGNPDPTSYINEYPSYLITSIARRYIVTSRIKVEVDTGLPVNPLLLDQQGDDESSKKIKAGNREVHMKLSMQFISHFICKDTTRRQFITANEYLSFLHYLITNQVKKIRANERAYKKQIDSRFKEEYNVSWDSAKKLEYAIYWLNFPGNVYSNTSDGQLLSCLIECLLISNELLKKDDEKTQELTQDKRAQFKEKYDFIITFLGRLDANVLSDYDNFRLDKVLQRHQVKKAAEQVIQITISEDDKDVAANWRAGDISFGDLLYKQANFAVSTNDQKEVAAQIQAHYVQHKAAWLDACRKCVQTVTKNKLYDLFAKESPKTLIAFSEAQAKKEIHLAIATEFINEQNKAANPMNIETVARYIVQGKILFADVLKFLASVENKGKLLEQIMSSVMRLIANSTVEEYEECLEEEQLKDLRDSIKELKFAELNEKPYFIQLMRDDSFGFFKQPDAQGDEKNMLNAVEVGVIDGLRNLFELKSLEDQKRVSQAIQVASGKEGIRESLKYLFSEALHCPSILQTFRSLIIEEVEYKTKYLSLERAIEKVIDKKEKAMEAYEEFIGKHEKFITAQAMDIIYRMTAKHQDGQIFLDLFQKLQAAKKVNDEIALKLMIDKTKANIEYGRFDVVVQYVQAYMSSQKK